MLEGAIQIHDRLIWEPLIADAREEIMVIDIVVGIDDSVWMHTVGKSGKHWNELDRIREVCARHPHPLPNFYIDASSSH